MAHPAQRRNGNRDAANVYQLNVSNYESGIFYLSVSGQIIKICAVHQVKMTRWKRRRESTQKTAVIRSNWDDPSVKSTTDPSDKDFLSGRFATRRTGLCR
jgi:hypothetical protein